MRLHGSIVVTFGLISTLVGFAPFAGATTIYSNNFSSAAGPEWSSQSREFTPFGSRPFLGQFGTETVTLSLAGIGTHTNVSVSFDLFVLRTWDGNSDPDQWRLSLDGITLANTTFNAFTNSPDRQAYPGSYPGSSFPGRTGAAETNTLGYQAYTFGVLDAVYKFSYTVPHSSSNLSIGFQGLLSSPLSDESWGIANVVVNADVVPEPASLAAVAGILCAVRRRR